MNTTYDLAIIGGGPAGAAAAVYAARKRLKTILITKNFEGQSAVSSKIENWIGVPEISGMDLAMSLKKHVEAYKGEWLEIKEGQLATYTKKKRDHFEVTTNSNETFRAKAILITTGSSRKKIQVPGSDRFENKGIVYCASCDGPLFADMDLIVVGAGNAAFETAAQLTAYAKSVTILARSEQVRADAITVEQVLAHPNAKIIYGAEVTEIIGSAFVEKVVYSDKKTNTTVEIPAQGVFVEIGSTPNTDMVADLVRRDEWNRIVANPKNQRTSRQGIWAAGDCTDVLFHQNNIAAGDAVKAIEDAYLWVHRKTK